MWSKGKVRDRDAYNVRTLARMMECWLPVANRLMVFSGVCPSDEFLETRWNVKCDLLRISLSSTYKCNLNDHAQCLRQSADLPTRPHLTFHQTLTSHWVTYSSRSVKLTWVRSLRCFQLHCCNLACRHLYMQCRKLHRMQLSLNYQCALSTLFSRSIQVCISITYECASLSVYTYVVCVCVCVCIHVSMWLHACLGTEGGWCWIGSIPNN